MGSAALILIVLSNQGYWFGGQTGQVEIQWTIKETLPDAIFCWDLMAGPVRIAGGKLAIRSGDRPSILTIQTPEVRARTPMMLVYRLERQGDEKILATGKLVIHLFPKDIVKDMIGRLKNVKIDLLDKHGKLADYLRKEKISFRSVSRLSELELTRSDLVLVAEDEIEKASFSSNVLVDLADRGVGVLIFRQTRCETLAGYPISCREIPRQFEWRINHPLWSRFEREDLKSWFPENQRMQWAINLSADEPALEIVWWPGMSTGTEPVPIDALVASRRIGKGQLVFCQIPLGDWQSDPRSQLFLASALDYLLLRPEPTPRPSERMKSNEKKNKIQTTKSMTGE
jgi:hypothetical protein